MGNSLGDVVLQDHRSARAFHTTPAHSLAGVSVPAPLDARTRKLTGHQNPSFRWRCADVPIFVSNTANRNLHTRRRKDIDGSASLFPRITLVHSCHPEWARIPSENPPHRLEIGPAELQTLRPYYPARGRAYKPFATCCIQTSIDHLSASCSHGPPTLGPSTFTNLRAQKRAG